MPRSESVKRLQDFADAASDYFWEMDENLRYSYISDRVEEITGIPPEWFIGKTRQEAGPDSGSESVAWQQNIDLISRHLPFRNFEHTRTRKDGCTVHISVSGTPFYDDNGVFKGYRGACTEITELKNREAELSEKTALLQTILDTVPALVSVLDNDRRIVFANKRAVEHYQIPLEDIIGKTIKELLGDKYTTVIDSFFDELKATNRTISVPTFKSHIYPERTLWSLGSPIIGDDGTTKLGILRITMDTTDLQNAEEQLRQAQKMEVIGQLTGGVAHDFNNLLSIIIGNLDFVSEMLPAENPAQPIVEAARAAALSGAELNRQLLAYSRQQSLSPDATNLNDTVSQMRDMLCRTLGETNEIEVTLADRLWMADADRAQVESALLNLAVNARDAMPEGGRLAITTVNTSLDQDYAMQHAEVIPGDYVALIVQDTGTGMTPEEQARAFEPFFTTKEQGKGTGLGLSMVYGFAKQSGGHVTIESAPDKGTTVSLYLPRNRRARTSVRKKIPEPPRSGGEKVLIVEDDPSLRVLYVSMAKDLGYAVLEAEDGHAALAHLSADSEIDLLLTDVTLPKGMSGPDIAAEAMVRIPGIRVLYMSGYSRAPGTENATLGETAMLLAKPFRKKALADKLREVLRSTD